MRGISRETPIPGLPFPCNRWACNTRPGMAIAPVGPRDPPAPAEAAPEALRTAPGLGWSAAERHAPATAEPLQDEPGNARPWVLAFVTAIAFPVPAVRLIFRTGRPCLTPSLASPPLHALLTLVRRQGVRSDRVHGVSRRRCRPSVPARPHPSWPDVLPAVATPLSRAAFADMRFSQVVGR